MFENVPTYGVDSKESWTVALSGFGLFFFFHSFVSMFPVLFPYMTRDYGFTRKETYDMYGMMLVVSAFSDCTVSFVADHVSARKIIFGGVIISVIGTAQIYFSAKPYNLLIQGVLYGIGRGCLGNQTPVVLGRHFKKYKITAFGMFRAGIFSNGLPFCYLVQIFATSYDIHGCFLLIGGVILNTLVFALLMRNYPRVTTSKPVDVIATTSSDDKNPSFRSGFIDKLKVSYDTLADPMFYLIFGGAGTTMVFMNSRTLMLDVMIEKGMPQDSAFILGMLTGLFGLLTCLFTGTIAKEGAHIGRWIILLSQLLLAFFYVWLVFARGRIVLYLIHIFSTIVSTAVFILMQSLALEYLGSRRFSRALGLSQMLSCIVYFLMSPLVSYFGDEKNDYDPLLFVCAAFYTVFGLLWLAEPLIMKNREKLKCDVTKK